LGQFRCQHAFANDNNKAIMAVIKHHAIVCHWLSETSNSKTQNKKKLVASRTLLPMVGPATKAGAWTIIHSIVMSCNCNVKHKDHRSS
jgi:hypothetical protein